jgi:cytochrome c
VKNLPLKNIAAAVIFALFITGFSYILAELLYRPKKLVKRGYEVAIIAKTNEESPVGGTNKKPNQKAEAEKVDIAALIKSADIDAGARIFKKCAACHNIEKGTGNKIGPNLFGIVGKKRAVTAGFAYSEPMKAKGGSWSLEDLNQFLTSPKAYIPGTKMTFAGLKKDQDRANVIAYLEKTGK